MDHYHTDPKYQPTEGGDGKGGGFGLLSFYRLFPNFFVNLSDCVDSLRNQLFYIKKQQNLINHLSQVYPDFPCICMGVNLIHEP